MKEIILAEPSEIIRVGIKNMLHELNELNIIKELSSAKDLKHSIEISDADIIILNSSFNIDEINFNNTRKIGIVYGFYDHKIQEKFDDMIYITDSKDLILEKIKKIVDKDTENTPQTKSTLSEREIDVLKLVVMGCINKEISDKLFISTHTVISHRKNISKKLGIKSVSGLTVYAILNKYVNIEDIKESIN